MRLWPYLAPTISASLGVVFFVASFQPSLAPNELVEVTGSLRDYSFESKGFHRTPKSEDERQVILSLANDANHYWTNALTIESARAEFQGDKKIELRLFVEQKKLAAAGAKGDELKAYGLWIDGSEKKTVEASLSEEKFSKHTGLRLLGFGYIALAAYLTIRKKRSEKRELRKHKHKHKVSEVD